MTEQIWINNTEKQIRDFLFNTWANSKFEKSFGYFCNRMYIMYADKYGICSLDDPISFECFVRNRVRIYRFKRFVSKIFRLKAKLDHL